MKKNSNTTLKRLDLLNVKAFTQNKPRRNIQVPLEVFTELAADGVISADTLDAIRASKDDPHLDRYELCTIEELKRMLTLCEQQ
ncbi:hypothetical protein FACS18949_04610 [Clostridia bacterium]|nr:hypothetical protein FACS189425_07420 [Clostridia bacterium]GHV32732.1 hypothetical protein FACS18949_04610 [Clostridia bacterium]